MTASPSRHGRGLADFGASMPADAPVTWAFLAVNIAAFIGLTVTGGSENSKNLLDWGAKFGPAILGGEWWRLATPMFLHIGVFHLLANSIGLIAFGGIVERIYGRVTFAAIYLMAGIAGNIASWWAHPGLGAGASGAVFGVLGAFAAYLVLNRRALGKYGSQTLISLAFIVVVNLALGFTSSYVDNAAHIGGFAGGAAIGFLLAPVTRLLSRDASAFRIGPTVSTAESRPGLPRAAATLAGCAALLVLAALWVRSTYT